MDRIKRYIGKSDLGRVRIDYGGEKLLFNLMTEVKITLEDTQKEVMMQPQAYGFLSMLQKKLTAKKDELKLEKDRVWAKRFIYFLTSEETKHFKNFSKFPAQDVARAYTDSDKSYIDAHKAFIKAKEDEEVIEACVKAFEQRASMLQTLSANERQERKNT